LCKFFHRSFRRKGDTTFWTYHLFFKHDPQTFVTRNGLKDMYICISICGAINHTNESAPSWRRGAGQEKKEEDV